MIRAHRIRINPIPAQEVYLRQACGVARYAFNWGRAEWEAEYNSGGKPSAFGLKKRFNGIKAEIPWVYAITKSAVEGAFSDLGRAFTNFFRECKSGKVGYPKFKSKHRSKLAFYLANDRFSTDGNDLKISKLPGVVNMTEALRFSGKILSGRVSFKAGHWWISIQVEVPDAVSAPRAFSAVGVDLGLKELAVCSDGTRFPNPRHLVRGLKKMQGLSRSLSRKVKGSANWLKAKARLARCQYRIARQRSDALHKMTSWLARTFTLIGLEDLNVAGMLKNRRLARSVSDAGFFEIRRQTEYKSAALGGRAAMVDRWYPSTQIHHACGHRQRGLTLGDREWTCAECGDVVDRDLNASRNIRDEAVRIAGAG